MTLGSEEKIPIILPQQQYFSVYECIADYLLFLNSILVNDALVPSLGLVYKKAQKQMIRKEPTLRFAPFLLKWQILMMIFMKKKKKSFKILLKKSLNYPKRKKMI